MTLISPLAKVPPLSWLEVTVIPAFGAVMSLNEWHAQPVRDAAATMLAVETRSRTFIKSSYQSNRVPGKAFGEAASLSRKLDDSGPVGRKRFAFEQCDSVEVKLRGSIAAVANRERLAHLLRGGVKITAAKRRHAFFKRVAPA